MDKLSELSTSFGTEIIKFCERLRMKGICYANINQLIRSGTSIGANISEAHYAISRADFINKLQLALKECNESYYWLKVFSKANKIKESEYISIESKCSKIRFILIASLKTAKTNAQKTKNGDLRSSNPKNGNLRSKSPNNGDLRSSNPKNGDLRSKSPNNGDLRSKSPKTLLNSPKGVFIPAA